VKEVTVQDDNKVFMEVYNNIFHPFYLVNIVTIIIIIKESIATEAFAGTFINKTVACLLKK
jgi:hypothetical protein